MGRKKEKWREKKRMERERRREKLNEKKRISRRVHEVKDEDDPSLLSSEWKEKNPFHHSLNHFYQ